MSGKIIKNKNIRFIGIIFRILSMRVNETELKEKTPLN